jgi:Asp-tRNA(Asn)/Glu-tRNA(Gln) amidotransferase A subunit family amidase
MRTEAWKRLAAILSEHDALLCPTMSVTAPKIGITDADFSFNDDEGRYHGPDITSVFNMTPQCPVLSVPAGWSEDNLPVGLQIVGRRFDDLGVLRIGAALEKARPWADRRPKI